jgi:hypothetical protein
MLRSVKELERYSIGATDGTIGKVSDFYFDDVAWVVRYFVVETGSWLARRRVLISPISIDRSNWQDKVLSLSITQDQVRNSPDIDTHRPVSRQHEMTYLGYYGYPYYWGSTGLWGQGAYPSMMSGLGYGGTDSQYRQSQAMAARETAETLADSHRHDDPHLRSCAAVASYHIHGSDGDIGHVQGFLVDEESWAIRYLIVNTSNWWLGHQVLISPQWIDEVSWAAATVSVDLTRERIQSSPEYDPATTYDRSMESGLYRHYGRSVYWPHPVACESAQTQLP